MRAEARLLRLVLVPVLAWLPPSADALPPTLQRQAAVLPAAERARLQQRHATLQAMTAAERGALRQRLAEWDALPLAERRRRRDAWHAWQALPSAERQRLQDTAAAYAALPPERQQALAGRYAELDDYLRDGWLLGPDLGADWPRLHGLFALVPERERAPLLAALRGLDAQARADLALLAQRTPPQERAELRRILLSTPPERRATWLRRQVDP